GQANLFWDIKLSDGRYPTRQELDTVSTRQPIAVRAGGHYSVLNSKAFEISNVAAYARSEGMMGRAVIHRDAYGEPTGLIGELDAVLPLPNPTGSELESTLRSGISSLFTRYGVTSVGEISETADGPAAFMALAERDELNLRTSLYLWVPGAFTLEDACRAPQQFASARPEMASIQGIKIFADGGFSSRNAATLTPYRPRYAHSPGSRGEINLSGERIGDILRAATNAGLQLAVHANGERAQQEAARAIIDTLGASPTGRLRTRLEHAGNYVTSPATIQAWVDSGVHVAPQPGFLYNFDDFLPEYLGRAGERGRHPFRSLLAAGVRLSASSDLHMGSEIEQTNPLFGVWNCVKRESFLGNIIEQEESIDLDTALQMHTLDAAALLGRESEIGSIAAGKHADITILEEDPHDVTVDQLRQIRADRVIVSGITVYEREGAAPPTAAVR
ncbi:MAG: putative periplasmic protein, partial [Cryobacterium sp.]|nr:putative periplasmic protein [Cryobacterium sp.]